MKKRKAQPEQALQMACTQWLEIQRRQRKLTYFAVPNGGYRRKMEAWMLQKTGTRAGIPDMVIAWLPAKILFVELKALHGHLTPIQKEVHEELRFFGFEVFVIKALDDLIKLITEKKGSLK